MTDQLLKGKVLVNR